MPNQLTKKIGPLPTYAWVGIGVAFIAMVWFMRRNSSDDGASATAYSDDGGLTSEGIAPPTQYIGSSDGSVYGSGTYSDAPYGDTGMPVGYPPDFLNTLLAGLIPNGYTPGPTIYEPPSVPYQTQPETGASVGTQVAKTATAPAKQTSFRWGDGKGGTRTYTKGDEAAFRAVLKKTGTSYAAWAKNHEKAARDVFGKMA